MKSKNHSKHTFREMSYRELQRTNSTNRAKLRQEDQKWLKENNYKNSGWNQVVNLYKKIEELLEKYKLEDWTLEDLYLEADRIGNKYLTHQEIEEFQQKLAKELNEVSEIIDQQFPDTEYEEIDFSKTSNSRKRYQR